MCIISVVLGQYATIKRIRQYITLDCSKLFVLIVTYFYYYVTCSFVTLSVLIVMYVPFCVFCLIVLFCVLFVCKYVLYYCHRMSTQLQLNIQGGQNVSVHLMITVQKHAKIS
jgi:hypothetical protein